MVERGDSETISGLMRTNVRHEIATFAGAIALGLLSLTRQYRLEGGLNASTEKEIAVIQF